MATIEEKAAAMESERHIEESQYTAAGDIQVTAADNSKSLSSSDVSYAIIIKYDDGYVKSKDGILRLLHVVFVFLYLVLAVSGGTYEGDYLSLPFAWHIRLIVFTCIVSLLVCIFVIGLHVTSTVSLFPVDWQLFDMVVYGVLALLFLLTIILLGVDVGDVDSYSQFIPESTAHVHIAALVFGICCMLLHGAVAALAIYQRISLTISASSTSHSILMSQQSSSSVAAAESGTPCA